MSDADLLRQRLGVFQLAGGQAIATGRDRDGFLSQGHLRRLGDHGAIHSSRERHGHAPVTPQRIEQPISLRTQFRVVPFAHGSPPYSAFADDSTIVVQPPRRLKREELARQGINRY